MTREVGDRGRFETGEHRIRSRPNAVEPLHGFVERRDAVALLPNRRRSFIADGRHQDAVTMQ